MCPHRHVSSRLVEVEPSWENIIHFLDIVLVRMNFHSGGNISSEIWEAAFYLVLTLVSKVVAFRKAHSTMTVRKNDPNFHAN
mmetsp:Transcript_24313/g.49245  ORF Transcript_24313/g.49245 Transcript_24313/m.49245 type:complete len:82 (-) Transcript_24313:50-295(-)